MPTHEEIRQAYAAGVEAVIALFEATFREMNDRLARLEGQLNKNSQNSHQPPSSDGYRRPAPKSLRKKTGRRSGGQSGHAGSTLEMVAEPDRVEAHWPERCAACGEGLGRAESSERYEARQVHDLPPIKVEVTEHRAMQVCCASCGAVTSGAFPAGVKPGAQYGSGVASMAVYAQVYQVLPLERTRELMGDVVGCRPSEGTLVNMLAACAERVAPIEAQIKAALLHSAVMHVDETGLRVGKKLHWLHSASTDTLTYYAVDAKRGRQAHERIGLLGAYAGVAVHDALSSYMGYPGPQALCNAHLLRDLTALEETTRQRWPTRLKTVLIDMKTAVEQAVEQGKPHLARAVQARLEADYDRLVKRALQANPRPKYLPGQRGRPRASPARNLAERLRDHKDSVLRFLRDFRVPFDNNQAERDLRMMKVKHKISGCFRSERGAHAFATVRGYISTARKQGFGAFEALRALFDGAPVALQLA
jgi:transposase